MEKLDRLGWAAGFSIIAYGVRIGIRVSEAGLLEPLRAYLPIGWRPASSNTVERLYSLIGGGPGPGVNLRRFHVLFANAQRIARTGDRDEVLEAFESDVALYCALMARRRLFVHAGVIGWKGRAILIPGRSFSGKSTLVKAFLEAGATYYSDEFAVLDDKGRVHPFARPLSLRPGSSQQQIKVSPEEFGASTGTGALPVAAVLLTKFKSKMQWRPRAESYGQGILGLLAHAPAARRCPDRAVKILTTSVARAKIWRGFRGEAAHTVQDVLRRLEN
ncbi:MAG TPA: hypothetical protein VFJ47_12330 [Terriglobales bacterium]|nr:hypothetical protein [Terriglobales bacterium]